MKALLLIPLLVLTACCPSGPTVVYRIPPDKQAAALAMINDIQDRYKHSTHSPHYILGVATDAAQKTYGEPVILKN